jgi:uncharacterized peroxidase-related enzyme
MTRFHLHDIASAPEGSKPILEHAAGSLGFVPNLFGILAGSPALLKGYTTLAAIFDNTSLTVAERQVVLLTVSAENGCNYCIAAHSAIARAQGVSEAAVGGVRDGKPMPDGRLEALRAFTRQVVLRRGWVPDQDIKGFLEAGFTTEQVLEVILGVGLKTLSNYANHMAATPLDAAFSAYAWEVPGRQAESSHGV